MRRTRRSAVDIRHDKRQHHYDPVIALQVYISARTDPEHHGAIEASVPVKLVNRAQDRISWRNHTCRAVLAAAAQFVCAAGGGGMEGGRSSQLY